MLNYDNIENERGDGKRAEWITDKLSILALS